jgi:hypothetical protein
MAKLFPEQLFVQIDDIDDGKVYRTVHESKDQLQFTESDFHKVAVYQLVKTN